MRVVEGVGISNDQFLSPLNIKKIILSFEDYEIRMVVINYTGRKNTILTNPV